MFYPIQLAADFITYSVFKVAPHTLQAEAINFFIYDTVKIFILLTVIIFAVSILRSFLPRERVRAILSRKSEYVGNILAALLGIITPFCTCSAIPLFLGFVEAGVPLGVTFTFLVASPMINEVALVMLLGMFGVKVAAIYVASGFAIAVFAGIIIGKLKVENLIDFSAYKAGASQVHTKMRWSDRISYAKNYTLRILKKVWLYVLLGIGVGAWIHGYVPADFLAQYAGSGKWYAVPVAVLIGIPLYSNAAGVIPLVGALTEKGVSMGTALAFMMSVTGLSLPEFLILKKVMKVRLIVIFAGIITIGIIFTGYLFNFVLAENKPELPKVQAATEFIAPAVVEDKTENKAEKQTVQKSIEAKKMPAEAAPAAAEKVARKSVPLSAQTAEKSPEEKPLPQSINLSVPFASQAPFGDWGMPYQEACEEAAVIMVHYFYDNKPLDAKIMDGEILKLIAWENKTFGYYQDTTAAEIARILREYFNYKNVEIKYKFTIEDIKREVAAGHPVILPAAGRLLPNPNFRQPGPVYHALIVKGYMRDGQIITNDPGTRNGRDFLYKPQSLMNALHEWNAEDILLGSPAMIVVKP